MAKHEPDLCKLGPLFMSGHETTSYMAASCTGAYPTRVPSVTALHAQPIIAYLLECE
jgi:hypothetical protein